MAIELFKRCCVLFWLQHTRTRADKKGKAYSCELSYNSVLSIQTIYINDDTLFFFKYRALCL
jgi:hypothetical protein